MIIEKIYNLLNEDELNYLKELCTNFVIHHEPDSVTNSYQIMNILENDIDKLNSLKNRISTIIENKIGILKFKEIREWWINRVTTETNKKDKFHLDTSRATIVIYLNDNFDGGEFEYLDEKNKKIKINPKENMALLMTDQLRHRVLPVIKGTRYSFVIFIICEDKTTKTLI